MLDHDDFSSDDLMGVALVPLRPPEHVDGAEVPQEYHLEFEEQLVKENVVRDNEKKGAKMWGKIRGSITVTFGDGLEAALERAKADGAGTQTKKLSEKGACCAIS